MINVKNDDQNQTIRGLIRDLNKKLNKDLNFKGSPKTSRNKNLRKSVERCVGVSSNRKVYEQKRNDLHTIKGISIK